MIRNFLNRLSRNKNVLYFRNNHNHLKIHNVFTKYFGTNDSIHKKKTIYNKYEHKNEDESPSNNVYWFSIIALMSGSVFVGYRLNKKANKHVLAESQSDCYLNEVNINPDVVYSNPFFPPKFSLNKLRQIYKSREQVIHNEKSNQIISEFHVCQLPSNPTMEDTFQVAHNQSNYLFGVFDGHSGTAASYFCRDRLFNFLTNESYTSFVKNSFFFFSFGDFFKSNHKESNKNTKITNDAALNVEPFINADNTFLNEAEELNSTDGLAGACVVVSKVSNDYISTAWAGDCRAVVGRKIGGRWKAIPLTKDHQVYNNNERQRLLKEHPNEIDVIYKNRVKGGLQPTRGFGDGPYKRQSFFNMWDTNRQQRRSFKSGWHPPYTTAEPEITNHKIAHGIDKFVILGTDGLFDDLSNQLVVDYIGEWIDNNKSNEISAAAYLIEKALIHASKANPRSMNKYPFNSVLTSEYSQFSALDSMSDEQHLVRTLSCPSSIRRRVHDDITVIVAFLNDEIE